MIKYLFAVSVLLMFAACSHKPILDEDDVKIVREEPSDCENVGTVTGRTMYANGSREEAIKDMKREAAEKGANYVKFGQQSGTGTVVTGTGYKCK